MTTAESRPSTDFIRSAIMEDLESGAAGGSVITRFPPEPNGYLHIGHAKAICIDFGMARDFADIAPNGTRCHLRFDDTNPSKEEQEYIDAIKADIKWLGFDWNEHEYYASDYFDQLYEWALHLIREGKAYVDDQTAEQIKATRGTPTEPGAHSPFRNRSVEENLKLFAQMKEGAFPDGARVLRAKLDMASPNFNMRDPVLYRIQRAHHHRTGDKWCIYPMYDYAHGQSDAIEGITHSLCSLEFENHRPLYNWFLDNLPVPHHPRQIEFARLNISHTITAKRMLRELIESGKVGGWDDPRMPTLRGLRRRGYTPASIRNFCETIGITKFNSMTDIALLEHSVREDLNRVAPRVMGVLNPLRVVIENFADGETDMLDAVNNPEDASAGTRKAPFSRVIYIERDDFMENPPRKFFRLSPGTEVRLRWAYFITCTDVVKNDSGEIVELRCTYDPATRGGDAPDGRKVKGTIHWVSAAHAVDAEVRLYDRLFSVANPAKTAAGGGRITDYLNPDSLQILRGGKVEPSLRDAAVGATFQLERTGYFCVDPDTTPSQLVLNRTVSLRDSWAKLEQTTQQGGK